MSLFLQIFGGVLGGILMANTTLILLLFVFKESFKKYLERDLYLFRHNYEYNHNSTNLKYAFLGEIYAVLRVIEVRKLLEMVDDCIEKTENDNIELPDFSVEGEYFNVYFKNIEKIGIVSPELAKDISAFYTFASSVVEDLNWMAVAKIEEVTKEKALKEMAPRYSEWVMV